ncbi:diguanylate cyclase/phosphodiesterase [Shewanella psychrophila]|uniref:Diguanylate cyclase/phosphodiesterase n=1 Tax=Shewanella psychrophila TaxID=225848 RepID=A0A1S6HLC9_9GAMM|nr:EAL domain-containing protein [Shewanella psychrophila]AQS36320.1 diguanylate cyclase/phosphodiesterase [Shewanella psychrophila]
MSLSRLFQAFLFILFAGITSLVYLDSKDSLQEKAQQRLASYQAVFDHTTFSAKDGKTLLAQLNKHISFQFFQYIHNDDSSFNLTQGTLYPEKQTPLEHLFPVDLPDTRDISKGRLQVKLYADDLIGHTANRFIQILLVLWLSYLSIAVFYLLVMARFKRSIKYAASYIESLSSQSFDALASSKLSFELHPLAEALEKCKLALKYSSDETAQENDKLKRVAFQDAITGFETRIKFTQKLESFSSLGKEQIGLLAMIKASELGPINQNHGRSAGDDYLAKIANCIRKAVSKYPNSQCYRISTADFAVFIPDLILKDGIPFLESLKSLFDEYQQTLETDSIAHVGLVPYRHDCEPMNLLTLSDTAVSIAQTLGPNCFHMQDKLNGDEVYGDTRWKLAIEDLIRRRAIKFYQQPIQPCRTEVKVYKELFSRFYNSEGKFLPTATVIAMAERHGMILELDKLIVMNTLKILMDTPALEGAYGINISSSSIMQESFVAWLKDQLIKKRHIAARLVFETNEAGMQSNLAASYKFVQVMHSVGARVSVEHFGMGFTSFKFFREVRPDFIKLDGTYTESIEKDTNNMFFIKMIVDISRRLGIRVIATSVERQEEKLTLEKMLIDGLQGYYIAQPQAIQVLEPK